MGAENGDGKLRVKVESGFGSELASRLRISVAGRLEAVLLCDAGIVTLQGSSQPHSSGFMKRL
jgi:hypothetical protein